MAKKKKTQEKDKHWHATALEVKGFFFGVFAVVLFLSLWGFASVARSSNWLGVLGHMMGFALHYLFGVGSFLFVAALVSVGGRMIRGDRLRKMTPLWGALMMLSFCLVITVIADTVEPVQSWQAWSMYAPHVLHRTPIFNWLVTFNLGGVPIHYLYHDLPILNLKTLLNATGTLIVFSSSFVASLFLFTHTRPSQLLLWVKKMRSWLPEKKEEGQKTRWRRFIAWCQARKKRKVNLFSEKRELPKESPVIPKPAFALEEPPPPPPRVPPKVTKVTVPEGDGEASTPNYSNYKLPPLSLLTTPSKVDQSSLKKTLRRQAEILEETLASFGIEAKVGQINYGPTIVSFEVHPSVGVKVQKIKALESDIALNMQAHSIRILAPIPGKAAVGIEIPNPQPQEVSYKELLYNYQVGKRTFKVPFLMGKTVGGSDVVSDLTKMPHCIIAGATGSGKSVCINTLVMSIVMTARPDQIRLLMIDPKKVELSSYTYLPHLLAPVITEAEEATAALNWLVKEMEGRYELLKHLGVRNIDGFNHRRRDDELERSLETQLGIAIPDTMPYIVGIIDELADLMMVSTQDIETPIARIAQMARAVGIHLVLATQRPSREVITGLIKANFPTRISFKVSSRVNSQIILDDNGGETLLGNGDMLFLPPGSPHLLRAQGAYIRDDDIRGVVDFITRQAPPNYVTRSFQNQERTSGGANLDELDSLYSQAYDVVISCGNASTTFLQRKLKIGYARAASIMDQLHENGVVGPADGSRPRKILVFDNLED